MLGMLSLLPLLHGWQYKGHSMDLIMNRGASPASISIAEYGWLLAIQQISADCYGTLKVQFQDPDLQLNELTSTAEDAYVVGAVEVDPGGFVQRYFRPDPNSTAGFFFTVPFAGGYYGAPMAYVPTVKVSIYLPLTSNQTSSRIAALASVIAITDREAFIQSLRMILDANASLKVDPTLLSLGAELSKEGKKQ